MSDPNLVHTVGFFQGVFTIILALSLGEALKNFVADSDERYIHWDRLPALVSFFFSIFPFFQSMSQHFYLNYLHADPAPKAYAGFLTIDGIVFFVEAACFFLMSRALSARHWRRFYAALLLLMFVDTLWGFLCLWRGIKVDDWIYINLTLAAALVVIWWFERKRRAVTLKPAILCMLAVIASTVASYYLMWDSYFPK